MSTTLTTTRLLYDQQYDILKINIIYNCRQFSTIYTAIMTIAYTNRNFKYKVLIHGYQQSSSLLITIIFHYLYLPIYLSFYLSISHIYLSYLQSINLSINIFIIYHTIIQDNIVSIIIIIIFNN